MGQMQRGILKLSGGILLMYGPPTLLLISLFTLNPLALIIGISTFLPGFMCGLHFIQKGVFDIRMAQLKRSTLPMNHPGADQFNTRPMPTTTSWVTKLLQCCSCSSKPTFTTTVMETPPTKPRAKTASQWSKFLSWFNQTTPNTQAALRPSEQSQYKI